MSKSLKLRKYKMMKGRNKHLKSLFFDVPWSCLILSVNCLFLQNFFSFAWSPKKSFFLKLFTGILNNNFNILLNLFIFIQTVKSIADQRLKTRKTARSPRTWWRRWKPNASLTRCRVTSCAQTRTSASSKTGFAVRFYTPFCCTQYRRLYLYQTVTTTATTSPTKRTAERRQTAPTISSSVSTDSACPKSGCAVSRASKVLYRFIDFHRFLSDGDNDCRDNSDEANCTRS